RDEVNFLVSKPEVKQGRIRIRFTPEEEIGRGVNNVDMQTLGAEFGYTIDGEPLGQVVDGTFAADAVTTTIHGVITHPGFAKDKMENALKIAGEILARLPSEQSPERTSGREGFIHPVSVNGGVEK